MAVLVLAVGSARVATARPQWVAGVLNAAHAIRLSPYEARAFAEAVPTPYVTSEHRDPTLPKGVQEVARPGHKGLIRESGVELVRGGKLAARRVYARRVLQAPSPATIAVGTSQSFVQIHGKNYRYARSLEMTATAYDASWAGNGRWTGQPTAIGMLLQYGVVAVDPKVVTLGSRLYVQGYGLAVAADTGSAIHGDRIDLFFWDSPAGTAAFGVRHLRVYVLNDPKLPPVAAKRGLRG